MGWTGYMPTHLKKGGIVDRKAECDAYFMEGPNRGNFQVLKSAMKVQRVLCSRKGNGTICR